MQSLLKTFSTPRRIAALLGSFLLFIGLSAHAQSSFELPCDDAPVTAVKDLPAPLSHWAEVRCTIYGHTIVAKAPWVWVYPGLTRPVHFPAQMADRQPEKLEHAAHYSKVVAQKLDPLAVEEAAALFGETIGLSPPPTDAAWQITMTNQKGISHTLFMGREGRTDKSKPAQGWGFWCAPGCKTGRSFVILYEPK